MLLMADEHAGIGEKYLRRHAPHDRDLRRIVLDLPPRPGVDFRAAIKAIGGKDGSFVRSAGSARLGN